MKEFKFGISTKIEHLRKDMEAGFLKNDCEKLEEKLVQRTNDTAIALTKELADKFDTKKNFRVIERQLKNLYHMAL